MSRKHILAGAVLLLALSLGVYFLFFRHIAQPDIVVLKSSLGERQVMQALRGSVTRYQINVPLPAGTTISWWIETYNHGIRGDNILEGKETLKDLKEKLQFMLTTMEARGTLSEEEWVVSVWDPVVFGATSRHAVVKTPPYVCQNAIGRSSFDLVSGPIPLLLIARGEENIESVVNDQALFADSEDDPLSDTEDLATYIAINDYIYILKLQIELPVK